MVKIKIILLTVLCLIISSSVFAEWNQIPAGTKVYDSTTLITPTPIIWSYTGITDANGMCTFALTTDGSITGTPIFTAIIGYAVIGSRGTASAVAAPLAYIVNQKNTSYIEVRAVRGTTLAALGDTLIFCGANNLVSIIVVGY